MPELLINSSDFIDVSQAFSSTHFKVELGTLSFVNLETTVQNSGIFLLAIHK